MKILKSFLLATFLSCFLVVSANAASFESNIIDGFLKTNMIYTEHFRIEFSNLVMNQPDSDNDGIADLIENIADYSEKSWDTIITDLKYEEPVDPGKRVIIVLDDRNTYLFAGAVGVTTALSDGVTPLIALDPWQAADVLKVTVAHEFYHAVQFGYDINFAVTNNAVNYAESTAVWVEDIVYDSINDYYYYLSDYFDYPDYSVFAGIAPEGSLFPYGLGVWPTFLVEYYNDRDVILDFWETYFSSSFTNLNTTKVYDALLGTIGERGDILSEVYQEFSYWNLDTSNYSEGSNFPTPYLIYEPVLGEYILIEDEYAPALYGTNYLYYENIDGIDDFHFHLKKPEEVGFIISLIPDDNNSADLNRMVSITVDANSTMNEELILEGVSGDDGVYVLVSPFNDDLDANTASYDAFDIGYVYYYVGDFGANVMNGQDLVLDGTSEKEGSGISIDEVRVLLSLSLNVINFNEDSVTFSWNRLIDSKIDGYEINYGTESGVYDQIEVVANAYITSRTVKGLTENQLYYFQVIAVDSNGNQVGDASTEIAIIPMEWIFTDVSNLDQHFEAIESLVELGIFEGYPDGSFKPNDEINRAEFLKILIEGSDISPSVDVYNNCFPDVNREWFAPYICYAKAQNMVNGYPDGQFRPAAPVNKVEALKMLFAVVGEGYENLTEGIPVSSIVYPDLDKSAWYAIYVWRASNLGILEETPGDNFNPDFARTRGEMSEGLYRYLQALSFEILDLLT